jgi:hypothetical protein
MSNDVKDSFITIITNIDEIWKYPSTKELKHVISFTQINSRSIIDDFKSLCEPKNLKECCKHLSYYNDILNNLPDDEEYKLYSDNFELIKSIYLMVNYLMSEYQKIDGKKIDKNYMPDFNFDS